MKRSMSKSCLCVLQRFTIRRISVFFLGIYIHKKFISCGYVKNFVDTYPQKIRCWMKLSVFELSTFALRKGKINIFDHKTTKISACGGLNNKNGE